MTSWRAWRSQVRTSRPELLVVLAHTETVNGESTLLIGSRSIARPARRHRIGRRRRRSARARSCVLLACASGVAGDALFGALPAQLRRQRRGRRRRDPQQAEGTRRSTSAAAAVVSALRDGAAAGGHLPRRGPDRPLGAACVEAGLLVGLLLVAHGEIDVKLTKE